MPVKTEQAPIIRPAILKTESMGQRLADAKELVIDTTLIPGSPDSLFIASGDPCRAPVPGKCTQRCHVSTMKEGK